MTEDNSKSQREGLQEGLKMVDKNTGELKVLRQN